MKSDFVVRELVKEDLDNPKDFIETLSNLSEVGNLSSEEAQSLLKKINDQDIHVFIVVTEDGKIIGSTTLIVEQKFIHKGGIVGHIHDVATKKGFEGMGVGSAVMEKALEYAKERNCYKVILECKDSLIPFYGKFGFRRVENSMRTDL